MISQNSNISPNNALLTRPSNGNVREFQQGVNPNTNLINYDQYSPSPYSDRFSGFQTGGDADRRFNGIDDVYMNMVLSFAGLNSDYDPFARATDLINSSFTNDFRSSTDIYGNPAMLGGSIPKGDMYSDTKPINMPYQIDTLKMERFKLTSLIQRLSTTNYDGIERILRDNGMPAEQAKERAHIIFDRITEQRPLLIEQLEYKVAQIDSAIQNLETNKNLREEMTKGYQSRLDAAVKGLGTGGAA
jgi:hypothetical protein